MAEIAESMGVKIRLSEPVNSVELNGRRLTALKTEQATYTADAFVVNADFADWMSKTIPNRARKRWSDERLSEKKYSCSTFMLYLGIDGVYGDLPHHNIHISSDYERNLDEIERQHVLSEDPSFYVQNASVTDPTLAPQGQSAMYVLVPVTHQHRNVDWSVESDRFRDLTLDKLAAIGLTDIRERIRVEHRITPADWESKYAIYRGATFNLAHNLDRCFINARTTGSKNSMVSILLAGELIPAVGCQ